MNLLSLEIIEMKELEVPWTKIDHIVRREQHTVNLSDCTFLQLESS